MKHLAHASLIATLLIMALAMPLALSSCATDKEGLPASAALTPPAPPGQADDAVVCRFGAAHGDPDQKKGCTTRKDRQDEKPAPESPAQENPFSRLDAER